ncbi:hypothetical protein RJ640_030214 [Escallonia rubra]|uniref:Uncharacterized protein n=1 Tax=Escallonia rubra TaxID=112253 RepID=A0AA88RUE1_9ASTE|nr:hypothetical protein RJ640_030214 [Escallonia rubra]
MITIGLTNCRSQIGERSKQNTNSVSTTTAHRLFIQSSKEYIVETTHDLWPQSCVWRAQIMSLAFEVTKSASTTCYVALSQKTEGVSGSDFADCNESYCSSLANDESEALQLWKQTRALINRRLRQPRAKDL